MNIISHGNWVRYTPTTVPATFPPGVMFAKRASDNLDWYGYVKPDQKISIPMPVVDVDGNPLPKAPAPPSRFQPGSVKATVHLRDTLHIVSTALYDSTMLFPDGAEVIEITGYTGSDPFKDFGGKVYNQAAGTFTDPPPPPEPGPTAIERDILRTLERINRRLDRLEHPHHP
jgi:hypothetical protein